MHIQPTLTDAQQGGRGEASFGVFENEKKCPDFEKKGPDCVHLWVEFSIQNVGIQNFSGTKISKMFLCTASISCVFDEMFIEVT